MAKFNIYDRIKKNPQTTILAFAVAGSSLPLVYLGKATLLEVSGFIIAVLTLLVSKDFNNTEKTNKDE